MESDAPLPRGLHVSITQLSEETGRTRETIARKLAAGNVPPSGYVRKQPVYRLRDALEVLYTLDESGARDPDKLEPHSRHSHYKAEREKLALAADAGEYIPREDYRDEVARVAKLVAQSLDAIPDLLERDCAATPPMIVRVQDELDKLREQLAQQLAEDGTDAICAGEDGDESGRRDHPPAAPDASERGGPDIFAL
jgi:hypothetical protein